MGKLIVIEGLDGSGKATQSKLLAQALGQRGIACRRIAFPNYQDPASTLVQMYLAGELGGLPEVNPWAASLFYAVDRYASFVRDWQKDYRQGTVIIADRYATSNIPHQMSKLSPEQWEEYMAWQEDLEYKRMALPRPDVVLYLDMPPEISQGLLSNRYGAEDKRDLHERNLDYLLKCQKAALFGASRAGWKVLPCAVEGNPLLPEKISQQIIEIIENILKV